MTAVAQPIAAAGLDGWRAGLFRTAVRLGDRAMERVGYRRGSPNLDEVLVAVRDEPGAAAIDAGVVEGLDAWLTSLRDEADLNAIGRIGAHWDAVRLLKTVTRFAEEEARDPAILAEPIASPIFITGLPRSGTTFLHTLLASDPAHRAPLSWQALAPYPPRRGPDRRRATAARQLGAFLKLTPGLASVHPLVPDTPQECTELFSPVFRSLRFDATHRVPSYRAWLDAAGHLPAYRFHRRFLQHLQHQAPRDSGPGQWVLKSPDHVFTLSALEQVYPDARFVFCHRDPLKVLPSTARLTELLRAPFARAVDPVEVGAQISRDWRLGAANMIAAARRLEREPWRVLHVHFAEIKADPAGVVERVYRHFGLPRTDAARTAISRRMAERPRGGYGRNRYSFERHGLDPAEEREAFRRYTDRFDVELEVAATDR